MGDVKCSKTIHVSKPELTIGQQINADCNQENPHFSDKLKLLRDLPIANTPVTPYPLFEAVPYPLYSILLALLVPSQS